MYAKKRSGVPTPVLCDDTGILLSKLTGGSLADAAIEGRLFMASNQAAVTTCTTKNNTFTGLAIVNPTGSGKLFVMHEFSYALLDSSSGDTNLSLLVGPSAGFTAVITPRCARWGHAASVALVNDSATITGTSGIIVKHIATIGTNATADLLVPCGTQDLGGSIVLPGGYACYTDTTLATGAGTIFFGFVWEEIDA